MGMPCCYTDDETPYCANRRHKHLPLCLHHTRETMRRAVLDGGVPWDVLKELLQFTDEHVKILRMAKDYGSRVDLDQFRADRETRRVLRRSQSIVYYVRFTGGRIKIGTTVDLLRRLTEMRARVVDVLATEPGGFDVEARRHRKFSHLRDGRSEDFNEDPSLLAHVDAVLAEHGQPVIESTS